MAQAYNFGETINGAAKGQQGKCHQTPPTAKSPSKSIYKWLISRTEKNTSKINLKHNLPPQFFHIPK